MRLSECVSLAPLTLVRDGEFQTLGALFAKRPHVLVSYYDDRYLDELLSNKQISCVITTPTLAAGVPNTLGLAVCDDAVSAFYAIHEYLYSETDFYWKSFDTEISSEARIHPRAYVAEKNVRIGRGTTIEPNATILERSIIGEDVVIRAGAVIGTEGCEVKNVGGQPWRPVPHGGGVRIHNNVGIYSNSNVDRNVFGGFTEIGEHTKIGNLVHVAHGVVIGKRCRIAPCTIISGSTTLGDDVWVGVNATVSSVITVGDRAAISLGAVVTRDVPPDTRVSGNFAIDHQKFLGFIKSIR